MKFKRVLAVGLSFCLALTVTGMQEAAGGVLTAYGQEVSGKVPENDENIGDAEDPKTDEAVGDAEEPETDDAVGDAEEPETDDAVGDAEEPETDDAAGDAEEPETDDAVGDAEEPKTDEAVGDAEEPKTDEAVGDAEEPETDEAVGDAEDADQTDAGVDTGTDTGDTEEPVGGAEDLEENLEENLEATTLTAEVEDYLITVTADPGVLPEDAELRVVAIEDEDSQKIEKEISHIIKKERMNRHVDRIVAFDAAILSGGKEIGLTDALEMTLLPKEQELESEETWIEVFHLDDDLESPEMLESKSTDEGISVSMSYVSLTALVFLKSGENTGWIYAGEDQTVAEAFEALSAEDVSEADGRITLCLTGDTSDVKEVFVPEDKGIRQITITGENDEDYRIGVAKSGARIFANGVPLVYEHGKINSLYGGGKNVKVDSTELRITGGKFLGVPDALDGVIVGGSLADERNVDVSISGSSSIFIEDYDGLVVSNIYCGSVADADGVRAKIQKTCLEINNSSVEVCMISGGCFVWSRADNSVMDIEETNLIFDNSRLLVGYFDWTFSIFGGHLGNDGVENLTLKCDATNIEVRDSVIESDGWGGGEIFGGHYHTGNSGTDTVTLGSTSIRLEDSTVNGVFGGGYYDNQCFTKTDSVSVYVNHCQFEESTAMDIPIVCGGDIYLSDTNYGQRPKIGKVSIALEGALKEVSIYAEGVCVIDDAQTSMHPEKAHLSLSKELAKQVDGLDIDSAWTDVTVALDNGKTMKISEYDDYGDLLDKIKSLPIVEDVIKDAENAGGQTENAVDSEQVAIPELPQGSTVTAEEVQQMKLDAIEDAANAVKNKMESQTVDLTSVLTHISGVKEGDQVETYLKVDLLDIGLKALKHKTDVELVPEKLILEVKPYAKIRSGEEERTQPLENEDLSGDEIEFLIGVPDCVKAQQANVVHHVDGGDITSQVEVPVEEDDQGKFVRLNVSSFSQFEITFLYEDSDISEPDIPAPDTPAPDTPAPDISGKHDYDRDHEVREDRWIEDSRGWWYRYENGTWPSSQWAYLFYGNHYAWYFFDEAGYMKDGWICWNGTWYYLNPVSDGTRGAMLTNTTTPDGYRVGADGAWIVR